MPPFSRGEIIGLTYQTPNINVVTTPLLTRRRRVTQPAKRSRPLFSTKVWKGYGTIEQLRTLLQLGTGVEGRGHAPQNAVIIALDTESEPSSFRTTIVEIGITVLRLARINGVEPGLHLRQWMPKMEHRHIVIDTTRRPKLRMSSSLFGSSMFLGPVAARILVCDILQACVSNKPLPGFPASQSVDHNNDMPAIPDDEPSELYLVGQSIAGDAERLAAHPLDLNLRNPADTGGVHFTSTFDIYALTTLARSLGSPIPSGKLGYIAKFLGVDPVYWDTAKQSVRGTHNANNDAAYTMMALLLYAVRWKEVISLAAPAHMEPVTPMSGSAEVGKGQLNLPQADYAQTAPYKRLRSSYLVRNNSKKAAMVLTSIGAVTGLWMFDFESVLGTFGS
ncbi:hypothetical protein LTR62_001781 [Meristemomyces frigidus]|uniref:Gfd2/YDR514C-like C-terminal domain-containing protein n=1 Tax=Meristemomyces frigidus TaxID=1508187 RepID=A0AAN7YSI0_9PEZI|nr:hypothetical protein LTR62_001781 [Meristemomyces frigidus]